jgi:NAD(P)-dependent dehydrogenase (short-subunit alcohol dehydrogenase family)
MPVGPESRAARGGYSREQYGRPTRTAIVDVSDSGQVGFAMSSAYVAAKHAVVGITKAAAWEHAADGIRVNAVGPGFIMTRCMIIAHQSPTRSSASTVSAHSRLAHLLGRANLG